MTETSVPTIRPATLSDAMILAELGAQTFAETFAADNKPEDMTAYVATSFSREQQSTELANPLSTFLIAEIDGIAVGYAMLRGGEAPNGISGENPIELVRFYVSQEWHGRGVGKALMQACLDESRRQDYRTLWLGVWEHNARAREFYRGWNFLDVGGHIFQLGSDLQNDILMKRTI
jgi:GNAT superfamily N-acetyltransferase